MEEGFVDVAILKNTESFKNNNFCFCYDNVDINEDLVQLVNAKTRQDGNYFQQFTEDSSSIKLMYWYQDIMRMKSLKRHHTAILCTACVGMAFTLKLLWLAVSKENSPTKILIIDQLSNGKNIVEFIANVSANISLALTN
jgi:hypothetical protein